LKYCLYCRKLCSEAYGNMCAVCKQTHMYKGAELFTWRREKLC